MSICIVLILWLLRRVYDEVLTFHVPVPMLLTLNFLVMSTVPVVPVEVVVVAVVVAPVVAMIFVIFVLVVILVFFHIWPQSPVHMRGPWYCGCRPSQHVSSWFGSCHRFISRVLIWCMGSARMGRFEMVCHTGTSPGWLKAYQNFSMRKIQTSMAQNHIVRYWRHARQTAPIYSQWRTDLVFINADHF